MTQADPKDVETAETILRHLKGIVSALETWVKDKKQ